MNFVDDFVRRMGQDAGGMASGLEILFRITLLLFLAIVLAVALRRSSASLRHLVWTLSVAGALLVPVFYWAFPAWRWAVLPAPTVSETPAVAEAVAKAPLPYTNQGADFVHILPENHLHANAGQPVEKAIHEETAVRTGKKIVLKGDLPAVVVRPAAWSWPIWSWLEFLGFVWILGTSCGLGWILIGLAGAWHVARRSEPAVGANWQDLLHDLIKKCGIRRSIQLRQCKQISVPMTWGFLQPVILIPDDSVLWPENVKCSVLLHELGHIRRRDCLIHLLGRLACAVYWFHPLVWLAAIQLRKTSEQAADDGVLSSNIAPPDYAEHLVRIAGQIRGENWFSHVVLPMASASDLEKRVVAILDTQRNRRSLTRRMCFGFLMLSLVLLIPCAILRLGYAQTGKETQQEEKPSTDIFNMNIQAVDATTGKPLADTLVEISTSFLNKQGPQKTSHKADAQGKAEIEIPDVVKSNGFNITVRPAEYVPQYYLWNPQIYPSHIPIIDQKLLNMRFKKGITIGGRIEDESGKALSGAEVLVSKLATFADRGGNWGFSLADIMTDDDGRWQCDCAPEDLAGIHIRVKYPDFIEKDFNPTAEMKELKHVAQIEKGASVTGRILDENEKPVAGASVSLNVPNGPAPTTTDAEGRFEIKPCQVGRLGSLTITADGFVPQFEGFFAAKETKPLTFKLKPGAMISGRVVDPQGKPIDGVWVIASRWQNKSFSIKMTTDKDGRFVWKGAPPDMVLFDILQSGFMSKRKYPLSADGEEHTITLYPKLVIQGTVVDEDTGRPINEFRLVRGRVAMEGSKEVIYDDGYVSGRDGRYEYPVDESALGMYLKIEAEGYKPAVSRYFKPTEGRQTFDFKLRNSAKVEKDKGDSVLIPRGDAKPVENANEVRQTFDSKTKDSAKDEKDKGPSGVILQGDGKPAENAMVMVTANGKPAYLTNGRRHQMSAAPTYQTNAEGRFTFVTPDMRSISNSTCHFIVVHDYGFGEASPEEFAKNGTITLQPWGRLEGTMHIGRELAKNELVEYSPTFPRELSLCIFSGTNRTKTDDQGRFVMERVIPGKGVACRVTTSAGSGGVGRFNSFQNRTHVDIIAGKTATVEIGGRGRPVVGRIEISNDQDKLAPSMFGTAGPKERVESDQSRMYSFQVKSDGWFRIEDVLQGEYVLKIFARGKLLTDESSEIIHKSFTMPEIPGGVSEEPLDLGTLNSNSNTDLNKDEVQTPKQETAKETKIVRGKVVDEAGKAIEGADVWLPVSVDIDPEKRRTVHTKTDYQGRFTLEVTADSNDDSRNISYHQVIWAYSAGRSIATLDVQTALRQKDYPEVIVTLPPASDTSFVVLKPDGKPLAGAIVGPYHFEVRQGNYDYVPRDVLSMVRTRTDKNGIAKLPAIPRKGLSSVKIADDSFGIQTLHLSVKSVPEERTIRLQPIGRIEGRIVADNVDYVKQLPIYLTTRNDHVMPFAPFGGPPMFEPEGEALVITDDQGRFVVPKIAEGALSIDTSFAEKLPVRAQLPKRPLVYAGETTSLEIQLIPGVIVQGKIRVKDTNKPITNVEICIYHGGNQSTQAISDKDGKFTARILPGKVGLQVISFLGEYVDLLAQAGTRPYNVPEDAKEFELPPIEVVAAKSITGCLVDETDRPVINANIYIVEKDRGYGDGAKTDKDGEFTLSRIPNTVDTAKAQYKQYTAYLDNAVGPVKSKLEVIQAEPLIIRVIPPPQEPVEETIKMKSVTGRLIDKNDRAVANAIVLLSENHRIWGQGKTDKDGQFTLKEVPDTVDEFKAEYIFVPENYREPGWLKAVVVKTDPLTIRAQK